MQGIRRVADYMVKCQITAIRRALNYPPDYRKVQVTGVKRTPDRVTISIKDGPICSGDKIEISLKDGEPKLIRAGGVWWLENVAVMDTGWNGLLPDYYVFGFPTLMLTGVPLGAAMVLVHQYEKQVHGMNPIPAYAWRCLRGQLDRKTREQLKEALQRLSHREYFTDHNTAPN